MDRRAGRRSGLDEGGGRRAVVRITAVCATLCAAAVALPAPAALASPDVPPYAFSDDARTVPAATGTTDAAGLEPGATYRSSLALPSPPGNGSESPDGGQGDGRDGGEDGGQGDGRGQAGGEVAKAYFRLELDDVSNVYVGVTAIPRAGSELAVGDGISVSVQDADSIPCSRDSAIVGASKSPHPVTAWAARELQPGRGACQKAGTYYVVVERTRTRAPASTATGTGTGAGVSSGEEPWELEIAPVSEPALTKAAAARVPDKPGTWDSATPEPPTGAPATVRGGAGFTRATAVQSGVLRDGIVPGQTLFYKVPVDWGQQVSASVDLGSADEDSGYVVEALDMTLYSPVRAEVKDVSVGYGGRQKSAALAPVPPVGYANRRASASATKALRFAGSYYLVVHLAAQVRERFGAGPYGLTLRVRVDGGAQPAPGYAGRSAPRGFFDVGARDPELTAGPAPARADASAGGGSDGDPAMTAVAVGGIGTGSLLLAVLGTWTLAARRRAAAQMRVNAQNPTA